MSATVPDDPARHERPLSDEAPHDRPVGLQDSIGDLVARGAVAGLSSGFVFLLGTMWYVTTKGLPAVAPLLDISTVFHFSDKPVKTPPEMIIGLVTHVGLSLAFGIVFALFVVPAISRLRINPVTLAVAGIAYGLLVYVVNFQILGRTLFPWFTNPMGPNQWFEIFIHAVFGLLLVPFFLGGRRLLRV